MSLVCLSYIMQDIYLNVYGYRDDPLEDLDIPREKIPWLPSLYTAIDIFTNNQKRVSTACIEDYPEACMANFMVYLAGFMTNEADKSQISKWLRSLFNLLEQPALVHRHWMNKLKFKIEDSKDHRRLLRNSEETENIFLRLLTTIFNSVRSLDLSEVVHINNRITTSHFSRVWPRFLKSLKLSTKQS